jgi:hypothetical protein
MITSLKIFQPQNILADINFLPVEESFISQINLSDKDVNNVSVYKYLFLINILIQVIQQYGTNKSEENIKCYLEEMREYIKEKFKNKYIEINELKQKLKRILRGIYGRTKTKIILNYFINIRWNLNNSVDYLQSIVWLFLEEHPNQDKDFMNFLYDIINFTYGEKDSIDITKYTKLYITHTGYKIEISNQPVSKEKISIKRLMNLPKNDLYNFLLSNNWMDKDFMLSTDNIEELQNVSISLSYIEKNNQKFPVILFNNIDMITLIKEKILNPRYFIKKRDYILPFIISTAFSFLIVYLMKLFYDYYNAENYALILDIQKNTLILLLSTITYFCTFIIFQLINKFLYNVFYTNLFNSDFICQFALFCVLILVCYIHEGSNQLIRNEWAKFQSRLKY